jgi:ATP-dependent DNA ligase
MYALYFTSLTHIWEGIVSKRRDAPYRSGRCPDWIKVKNPDAPAAIRIFE